MRNTTALRHTHRHPTPENTALVLEVSESSLVHDRTVKAPAYARSGIQEYWILNLRQRQPEIRRDPGPVGADEFGYRFLQPVMVDGEAAPLEAPDRPIQILDMLPSDMASM